MDMAELGRRIREERKRQFLKQGDLSGDEFSKGYISLIEKGKISPSLKALNFIAQKLNKPVVYFLDEDYVEKEELKKELSKYKNILEKFLNAQRAFDSKNYEEAIKLYLDILNNAIDEYSSNLIKFYLAKSYLVIKDYQKVLEILDKISSYFEKNSFNETMVEIHYMKGLSLGNLQKFQSSLENYLRALDGFEKYSLRNTELKSRILFSIASLYSKMGEFIKARDYYIKCLEYSTQIKAVDFIALSNNGLGLVNYELKQYKDALKYIRRAILISKTLNLKEDIANEYNYLGFVYTDLKKYDIAEKYFLKSYSLYKDLDDKKGMAYNLTEIGRIYYLKEDYQKALEYLNESLEIVKEINEQEEIGRIHTILGNLHLKQGQFELSEKELLKSVEILKNLGLKKDLSEAYKGLGNLYIALNNTEEAKKYFNQSIELLYENLA
ncbi:helix-turn-helix domain protein [Thermoanaerobacter mathranii subsp. mathranii str. A3]|jgi:tetratricopeptide (TPR) repeat protein|uniref:Tetratricopeptide (TPR) repeat protein n=2 Tax=Thermoanaerobacter TaxID=1754 RepID=A0ABT9M6L2_9THEO|nr:MULTISPECIES: tetratricopeptide repeat protein [Thermoanaerobacter]ADH61735.1 helix-turn-helix domain protein [Thermoanaerobacter mathranii subsp. mathranii str. A3]MBT1279762.1 helix-turn-helix transcriptional regulator [Thermoanaerobacter sp. CM-CNRG TB177]MDP9751770.1 tetratricopeptide (TPR) repeat protein [Thermoanaerobacter pentosaceus]